MTSFSPSEHPHRRLNPLTGEWILVSPQRTKRPWQGLQSTLEEKELPPHDPDCYLCSGNKRASGDINPDYKGAFIFENDFPALLHDAPTHNVNDPLFSAQSVLGLSRVICYSENHSLTLAELKLTNIRALIEHWCDLYRELGQSYQWVQIFENKGAINGCSNPHPHGQVWASNAVPSIALNEDQHQRQYLADKGRNLLHEYCERELKYKERIVLENKDWIVVTPYWATWPFETMLLPIRQVAHMESLSENEKESLTKILKEITVIYDNLFKISFPYSMGWHSAPYTDGDKNHWQLHAHFYPPLLRSASIKKFMVGYEMLAEAQRDMTPEQAAKKLREQSTVHYKDL